jgi:peptidoglycan/LPS O-acetylase OafA/YrhL
MPWTRSGWCAVSLRIWRIAPQLNPDLGSLLALIAENSQNRGLPLYNRKIGKELKRSYTLDAMRGIAAIIVVFDHLEIKLDHSPTNSAHPAVDFFFVLSGFVIAAAYRPKLKNGMSIGSFFEARLVRLYPLFALGAALGLIIAVGRIELHANSAMTWGNLLAASVVYAFAAPDRLC